MIASRSLTALIAASLVVVASFLGLPAAHAVLAPFDVALLTNGVSPDDHTDILNYLNADSRVGTATLYNAPVTGIPSLATLQSTADAVLFCTDSFAENQALMAPLGNLLADFKDAGGGVVMGTFAWNPFSSGNLGVGGRIMTTGYSPFASQPGQGSGGSINLATSITTHPILQGVTSFNSEFDNLFPTVDVGAVVVARYVAGNPLVAVNAANDVVALNFFPTPGTTRSSTFLEGDYARLVVNALEFVAIPEPSSGILVFGAAAVFALRSRGSRRQRPVQRS